MKMNNLDKLKLILEMVKENNLTAYEIGKNTNLSTFAVQKILKGETKKTKRKRIVPINNHLLQHYLEMNLDKQPQDFYLFGSHREAAKGNI